MRKKPEVITWSRPPKQGEGGTTNACRVEFLAMLYSGVVVVAAWPAPLQAAPRIAAVACGVPSASKQSTPPMEKDTLCGL